MLILSYFYSFHNIVDIGDQCNDDTLICRSRTARCIFAGHPLTSTYEVDSTVAGVSSGHTRSVQQRQMRQRLLVNRYTDALEPSGLDGRTSRSEAGQREMSNKKEALNEGSIATALLASRGRGWYSEASAHRSGNPEARDPSPDRLNDGEAVETEAGGLARRSDTVKWCRCPRSRVAVYQTTLRYIECCECLADSHARRVQWPRTGLRKLV
ncbi:unnamed protein product [Protopolystoma xenopodis]|uniref:Uncharacterized protein n=1 Tax=Protopolystoma xenopodis TaxID=117903 RepID=A0A448XP43_9PLAT|nr:unnamed protein product [Protopolystoma xenopodis]